MTRRAQSIAAAAVAALLVAAYMGRSYFFRSNDTDTAPQQTPASTRPSAPAAPQLVLDITVDGLAENTTWPGEPMIVDVTVMHPSFGAKEAAPMPVDAGSVSLEVTDMSDQPAAWPFQHTPAALTVDHARIGRLTFVLDPTQTAQFAAGSYTVRARGGNTMSAPAFVDVTSRPPSLSHADELQQAERLAFFRVAAGDTAGAVTAADDLVNRQPRSAEAHALRAMMLETANRKIDALTAWNQAVALAPKGSEPVRRLYTRARHDLFREVVR